MARKKTAAKPKKAARRVHKAHRPQPANDDAPQLSRRPVWQGNLRLSLVSCPVALYNATSRTADISFHLLNPKTNNRIRMVPTDPDEGPVERADLVKGYEIEKNHYVVLTPDELDAVKLETTRTLDIERFVDETEIDRLYWDNPFYLLPGDEKDMDAYLVIRDAMAGAGRIALGRVVMHTRERLMAVEARGKGLIAWSLRMGDEVIAAADAFEDIPDKKPDRRMIEIAEKIIQQQEGPFTPSEFKDRYEKALRELIRRKEKGEKLVTAEPVEESNVIDLMDALKKSLKSAPAKKRKVS
ncbi:MAG TPA: Ku protein [Rhizomicrobium sp.]|jgi:DNA end-binding protein Ku|nr:Ku protein [Rhizomicrobium sp.]